MKNKMGVKMLKIASGQFEDAPELHGLATKMLNATIMPEMNAFYEERYQIGSENKVNWDKVYRVIPKKFISEVEGTGISFTVLFERKLDQFMRLLLSDHEKVPDLLMEYILGKTIENVQNRRIYITDIHEKTDINSLRKLLKTYFRENNIGVYDSSEGERVQEIAQMAKEHLWMATRFPYLLGIYESYCGASLAFWDDDYSWFDMWGFEKTIDKLMTDDLIQRGYNHEYVKNMFEDISLAVPDVGTYSPQKYYFSHQRGTIILKSISANLSKISSHKRLDTEENYFFKTTLQSIVTNDKSHSDPLFGDIIGSSTEYLNQNGPTKIGELFGSIINTKKCLRDIQENNGREFFIDLDGTSQLLCNCAELIIEIENKIPRNGKGQILFINRISLDSMFNNAVNESMLLNNLKEKYVMIIYSIGRTELIDDFPEGDDKYTDIYNKSLFDGTWTYYQDIDMFVWVKERV